MSEIKDSFFSYPMYGYYVRDPNRVYSITDFDDGEYIRFHWVAEHPSSRAAGYAWYKGIDGRGRLIHKSEIREVSCYEQNPSKRRS